MLFTASIFSKRIVNFLLNIILARIISLQDFGEYSSYLIVASYILLITEFGYSEYTLIKGKQNNNFSFLFTNFTFLSIITFVGISTISMTFEVNYIFLLILGKVYMEVFLNKILLSHYQHIHNFRFYSLISFAYSLFLFFVCIYIFYFPLELSYVLLIVNLFLLTNVLILFKNTSLNLKLLSVPMFIKSLTKDLIHYGLSSVTVTVYMLSPLLVMTYLLPKEDVAVFYVAYMIASVMILLSVSINQQYLPKIIGQKNDFFLLILKPLKLLFALNIVMLMLFYFFGEWILHILFQKEAFIETNQYLLLLIISNLFQSISGLLAMYLVGNDLLKRKFSFHLEFIFISLIVSFPLIYNFELYGVACSFITIYSFALLRTYLFIKKDKIKCMNK